MFGRRVLIILFGLVFASLHALRAEANSKTIRLAAPEVLVASGFLKHLLPRFSLKTGIRFEFVADKTTADAILTEDAGGTPVFSGLDKSWFLLATGKENEHLQRFEDWVTGEVGRKTIGSFMPDGKPLFTAAVAREKTADAVVLGGDALRGEQLAVLHCGRCHMVNDATRMTTIGSSPSFAVMRSFSDWQDRFGAFFVLNPHPSFTKIDGVTEPFDVSRPPPIVPVELTLNELDAILAFVSRIEPADLGAPIQYQ